MRRLAVVMIMLAFCAQCTQGNPPPTVTVAATAQHQDGTDARAAGISNALKAHIDPETGELTTPAEQENPAVKAFLIPTRSIDPAEKMQEQSSPVPGGGTMIDLKGRFHNPLTATIVDDGQTRIEHLPSDQTE